MKNVIIMHGTQGNKRKKACHLVLELKLEVNEKMGEEMIVMFPDAKHSGQTKVKKVATKEAHESKKLAAMVEFGFTKKLPKMPKAKKVRLWALQVKAYFESQVINMDVDRFKLVQSLLRDNTLE
jgi:hypothetical protein